MPTGVPMRYPYSLSAKLARFPYKWFWNNSRFVRFLGLSLVLTFPIFYKIHRGVNSPANKQQWAEIRKKRDHTHFDPPSAGHH
ncbi:uncharacterized protein LOC135469217 [Liolophura sinensis]|uniref:uncharacterized protein LOC135469217 n=1 Tax=Liolophura sinensis TaxID=3198878 RepID=UPI00315972B0